VQNLVTLTNIILENRSSSYIIKAKMSISQKHVTYRADSIQKKKKAVQFSHGSYMNIMYKSLMNLNCLSKVNTQL